MRCAPECEVPVCPCPKRSACSAAVKDLDVGKITAENQGPTYSNAEPMCSAAPSPEHHRSLRVRYQPVRLDFDRGWCCHPGRSISERAYRRQSGRACRRRRCSRRCCLERAAVKCSLVISAARYTGGAPPLKEERLSAHSRSDCPCRRSNRPLDHLLTGHRPEVGEDLAAVGPLAVLVGSVVERPRKLSIAQQRRVEYHLLEDATWRPG